MSTAGWRTVAHPTYGIRASLPEGWAAEASHSDVIPADVWALRPAGKPLPAVVLLLGWLPRGGRQSAFFPGGRVEDAHPASIGIAGAARAGMLESSDRHFMADFDAGELAVSVNASVERSSDWPVVRAILAHLALDAVAPPPSEPRRALDLARGYAAREKLPSAGIVYVGPGPRAETHRFTLLHDRGPIPLLVDVAAGRVEPEPPR